MKATSSATTEFQQPLLAIGLLWVWTFLDIVIGALAFLGGGVGLFFSQAMDLRDPGDWDPTNWLVLWAVCGTLLLGWGIYTWMLAAALQKEAPGAAGRAYRATRLMSYSWAAGVLLLAGYVAILYVQRKDGNFCLTLTGLGVLVWGGIFQTQIVLRQAEARELARRAMKRQSIQDGGEEVM